MLNVPSVSIRPAVFFVKQVNSEEIKWNTLSDEKKAGIL